MILLVCPVNNIISLSRHERIFNEAKDNIIINYGIYSILKCTYLEKFFHLINNIYQKIKFTIEGESNRELEFLETLLKANNGKISVLDIESLHIQFNTYTTTLTTK